MPNRAGCSGKVINTLLILVKTNLGWIHNYYGTTTSGVLFPGNERVDLVSVKSEDVATTPTLLYHPATFGMIADGWFSDYALFALSNATSGKFKEFSANDLKKITIRRVEDGEYLFYNILHLSYGAEMFYKEDRNEI